MVAGCAPQLGSVQITEYPTVALFETHMNSEHWKSVRGSLQDFTCHNINLSAEAKTTPPEVLQRVIWIQTLTLIWMSVEAWVSLGAAWAARSPALLGFGGDSAVELLSAAVVLWRFYSPSRGDHAEQRAARIAGGLLFVLAAFVAIASILTLLGHVEARPSPIGIVMLILAAVVMPWLARRKRQLSIATANAALRADAAESSVCGYLALIALAGLALLLTRLASQWTYSWQHHISSKLTSGQRQSLR